MDTDDFENSFEIPGFSQGGRVERTGIALVHVDERIIPAPGSEAVISPPGGAVVNYHFPVEIQAMGALPATERRRLASQLFDGIERELAARG
ncbi:hypothetical protein [Amycolatopsis nigrescens]|uniref:hypothetical protein n=1 Tax=Amycolatopsis nigrescens TaxID=381445 RepID=UPI00037D8F4C|nr:hypothetical protein [Amycolatopsis nigrescens]